MYIAPDPTIIHQMNIIMYITPLHNVHFNVHYNVHDRYTLQCTLQCSLQCTWLIVIYIADKI